MLAWAGEVQRAGVQAGHVQDGDVALRVVEHHLRPERRALAGDDHLLLGHPGHHVRVGEHVVRARYTKPDPSICSRAGRRDARDLHDAGLGRRQPGRVERRRGSAGSPPARPRRRARRRPARRGRSRAGCGSRENIDAAPRRGISRSTARSTAESLTCREMAGNGAYATAEPISQAISSTESTLTTAPPTESGTWPAARSAGTAPPRRARRRAAGRSWRPGRPRGWPMIACQAGLMVIARAIRGPKSAPIAPPPMKPAKLSTPMMKPWRYPATPKAITSTMQDQVQQITRHEPNRIARAECAGKHAAQLQRTSQRSQGLGSVAADPQPAARRAAGPRPTRRPTGAPSRRSRAAGPRTIAVNPQTSMPPTRNAGPA